VKEKARCSPGFRTNRYKQQCQMLPRSQARPLISILAHSRIRQHVRALRTSPRCLAEQPFSTVNDAEIAHFSRLSELWWDERGEFALLHKMNAHRMRFIREKLLFESVSSPPDVTEPSRVLAGLDALDVGCGGGILSEASPRTHVSDPG
jgi:polyprenyldihydroxybenzoate methyltransferase/3-demethylubiquinol 3-O-methyltransferase